MKLFTQGGCATPTHLLNELYKISSENNITGLKNYHIHLEGQIPYANDEGSKFIRSQCFFVGSNLRKSVNSNNADYIPIFLSDIPKLFYQNIINLDIALINCSYPDHHGNCTLGISVDIARSAIKNSKIIVAMMNKKMPRTHGDGIIHISHIDHAIEMDVDP